MKFGVLGYPLGHSLSPALHSLLFPFAGQADAAYSLHEVAPEALPEALPTLLAQLDGLNITIPHKRAVIPFLDALDDTAARYGAVNTIACRDGKTTGYNTDCIGFVRAMQMYSLPLAGNALLIGAGGVGRVMAFEAARAGCRITVVEPEEARAKALEADLHALFPQAEAVGLSTDTLLAQHQGGEFSLVLNASPVGMFPKVDACPLPEAFLRQVPYAFDAVYNPAETKAETGLAMLVLQAAAAQEIWFGAHFTDMQIRDVLAQLAKKL